MLQRLLHRRWEYLQGVTVVQLDTAYYDINFAFESLEKDEGRGIVSIYAEEHRNPRSCAIFISLSLCFEVSDSHNFVLFLFITPYAGSSRSCSLCGKEFFTVSRWRSSREYSWKITFQELRCAEIVSILLPTGSEVGRKSSWIYLQLKYKFPAARCFYEAHATLYPRHRGRRNDCCSFYPTQLHVVHLSSIISFLHNHSVLTNVAVRNTVTTLLWLRGEEKNTNDWHIKSMDRVMLLHETTRTIERWCSKYTEHILMYSLAHAVV